MNATSDFAAGSGSPISDSTAGRAGSLQLRRPVHGRMLAGVAAGVARTLGVDPLIVRLGFVVLVLMGGAALPLYLAGWLLIPDERTGRSLAAELIQSISAHRH